MHRIGDPKHPYDLNYAQGCIFIDNRRKINMETTEETKIPTPMELVESIRQLQRVDWDQATDSFAGITCRLIDKNYKNDNTSALAILKIINEKVREEYPNGGPASVMSIVRYSLQIEIKPLLDK